MKNLTLIFAVLALAVAPCSFGQSDPLSNLAARASSARYYAYELKNVQVTSYELAAPPTVTVTQGASSYQIIIGPATKFTRTVNGATQLISREDGLRALRVGMRIDVRARQSPNGIIAVLIAL